MPEHLRWRVDEPIVMSPGDYLIGHLTQVHEGDEESLWQAAASLLAVSLAEKLADADKAIEMAQTLMERGPTLSWDGRRLKYNFDDEEVEVEPGTGG